MGLPCHCQALEDEEGQEELCQYVPPEVPKSFKPNRIWLTPTVKMEGESIYREAYKRLPGEKSLPAKGGSTLKIPDGKISDATTTRLTYRPFKETITPHSCVPKDHRLIDHNETTNVNTIYKIDYTEKPISVREPMPQTTSMLRNNDAFCGKSMYKETYIDSKSDRPKLVLPSDGITLPKGKISSETTQKIAYTPIDVLKEADAYKRDYPNKSKYTPPEGSTNFESVYTKCYVAPKTTGRPKSCKKILEYVPPTKKVDNVTEYKEAYKEVEGDKQDLILPTNSIFLSNGKIIGETSYNIAYKKKEVRRLDPIVPCPKRLIGNKNTKADYLTTTNASFIPLPKSKVDPIYPVQQIFVSSRPLAQETTTSLAYRPVGAVKKTPNLKPSSLTHNLGGKFYGVSTYKDAYIEQPLAEKPEKFWIKASADIVKVPTNYESVQSMSYRLPGRYVRCDKKVDTDCIPCPEGFDKERRTCEIKNPCVEVPG